MATKRTHNRCNEQILCKCKQQRGQEGKECTKDGVGERCALWPHTMADGENEKCKDNNRR